MKELLMGNEAIALGALAAGVGLVSGYPGTPSTEVLETAARRNPGHVYCEWSVNEKVALEVAAGASYAGLRAMVTMKQVGLSVASDPLMNLNYVGVKGGLVLVVADDPGPISSQTEQDTRHFGRYAKIPVLDPKSPEEAYHMMRYAFELSETHRTPVIIRPTTRVCHSCATVEVEPFPEMKPIEGFIKDDARWVIFPKLAYQGKLRIVAREEALARDLDESGFNGLIGEGELGIVSQGISAAYVEDAARTIDGQYKRLTVATPYPFPEALALRFMEGLKRVLVIEELDPVLEDELTRIAGAHHLDVEILGKRTGHIKHAGENLFKEVDAAMRAFLGQATEVKATQAAARPPLAQRPPVLCAGCPHRGSFYAVKMALRGKKAVFTGDIGCYTLGNAAPLHMVDTCLCMGAGITIAQGLKRAEPEDIHVAFIGDSTFFHTGIPGVINAVYNGTDFLLVVLDNSTTAMTGNQPHPGTGKTMMNAISEKIRIDEVLRAVGVKHIQKANPFDFRSSRRAIEWAVQQEGVRAVIFEGPCIAVEKPGGLVTVNEETCIGCGRCVRELGCPAILFEERKASIDSALCTGCGLCTQVCPVGCIVKAQGVES